MRHLPAVALIAALAAAPLWAQTKLDKAVEKAHKQVEKGQTDDAVKTLSKAAGEAGAPGYLALARLQERLGHLEEAGAAYDQAREVATPSDRPEALAADATFALRVGTGQEALELANQAVEAGATATTLATRARALARTEEAQAALEVADRAVAMDPRSALAHTARGEALFVLGRNAEAEQTLRQAVGLAPDSALAHSRLARVLIALGQPRDAVAAARQATQVEPTSGEGFAILGLALLAEDLNNWGEAVGEAQQGAFLDPTNPIVQTAVGRIFEASGRDDLAVEAFRTALKCDPGFTFARLALIEAELARGNREAAMEEATRAAAANPESPEIQMLLGEMAERRGDHAAALGFLERALEALPGNADGWALLGRAYQLTGRPTDAAEAYGRAVELAPQNFGYRTTHGLLLGVSGDLDGGLAELEKVVQTPGYAEDDAWVNLGWIHRNRNEPTESIAAYRKAVEIDPEQPQAALGLGWALTQVKEYDEAISWYRKAVALDEALASDAYWGTTMAHIYKLDVEKAREFEKKTIAAGRSDPRLTEYIQALEAGLEDRAQQMERWQAEQEKAAEVARRVGAARSATRSRDPAVRARGARGLVQDGESGVELLIYLMRTDPDWNVRIAATQALGAFGPAAGEAVAHMEGLERQERYIAPVGNATEEQLNNEMLDGDFRKALREALAKIKR